MKKSPDFFEPRRLIPPTVISIRLYSFNIPQFRHRSSQAPRRACCFGATRFVGVAQIRTATRIAMTKSQPQKAYYIGDAPAREDKPPRRKSGGQRRLAVASVFAKLGVAPSPLFEWALFVTLCEHKVTLLAHRSAPSPTPPQWRVPAVRRPPYSNIKNT